jgi:hypothetical protein
MPRKIPKHINYMDMKIPFETLRTPKAKTEQEKLIKRFETEFGTPYLLDPLIDPCEDIDLNGFPIYKDGSIEEKIERIKRRNYWVKKLSKAIDIDNHHDLVMCNRFRKLPYSPKNDNGWNIAYKEETKND